MDIASFHTTAVQSSGSVGRIRCVHYLGAVWLEHGGVVRLALDLCSALAARGHDVTLASAYPRDVPADWNAAKDAPRVIAVTPRHKGIDRESLRKMASAIASADVLHLHGPWEPTNRQLAGVARRLGIPYILSTHGMLDDWSLSQRGFKKRLFLALAGRRLLSGAATVHCTAEAELRQCQKFLRSGSGAVIPPLVDLSPYLQLAGRDAAFAQFPALVRDRPRVLFLSRLHPKKGPDLLIDAVASLITAGTPLQLILAGPGEAGYVGELEQLVHDRGIESHVIFPGMVQGPGKLALYQAADVFVLPTSQENFGLVLIEALASGTPVVTTRGVDIWPELQQAGAAVVDRTSEAIAGVIRSVLQDPQRACATGLQGREFVFRWLDTERIIKRYEDLYRNCRHLQ